MKRINSKKQAKKRYCCECGGLLKKKEGLRCGDCWDRKLARFNLDEVLKVETVEEKSVLAEADGLINGDRQASYSHPTDDYRKTVGAFNALTGHNLTVKEGMMFMVCVKLSRECYKAKRDNLVDACGYIGCIEKHEKRMQEEQI